MLFSILSKLGIYQDPSNLRDDELEKTYFLLKKEANSTNSYELKQNIYRNRSIIIKRILERHKQYYADLEYENRIVNAKAIVLSLRDHDGVEDTETAITKVLSSLGFGLGIEHESDDVILYLCFFIFENNHALGGHANKSFSCLMLRLLEHLINVKHYNPAIFFKGLVMKYGVDGGSASNIYESKLLLEEASSKGVASASIELRKLTEFN